MDYVENVQKFNELIDRINKQIDQLYLTNQDSVDINIVRRIEDLENIKKCLVEYSNTVQILVSEQQSFIANLLEVYHNQSFALRSANTDLDKLSKSMLNLIKIKK